MTDLVISSLQNPRIKNVVKLRQRSHRDEAGLMLVEGYREIKRALDNEYFPVQLFVCEELFQGENEPALIERCRASNAEVLTCTSQVFQKIAYRDRPDGLLAVAPQISCSLGSLDIKEPALFVVTEAIEKPGNLGTILRTADATGTQAVIVCDRCTDINNPNVVRASVGTIFSLPVIESTSEETIKWLKEHKIQIVAATPHAQTNYTLADLRRSSAIVVGTEQYGLSELWLKNADVLVTIPMLGQADSLNVAAATTILLYETVRQRSAAFS